MTGRKCQRVRCAGCSAMRVSSPWCSAAGPRSSTSGGRGGWRRRRCVTPSPCATAIAPSRAARCPSTGASCTTSGRGNAEVRPAWVTSSRSACDTISSASLRRRRWTSMGTRGGQTSGGYACGGTGSLSSSRLQRSPPRPVPQVRQAESAVRRKSGSQRHRRRGPCMRSACSGSRRHPCPTKSSGTGDPIMRIGATSEGGRILAHEHGSPETPG